MNTLVEYLKKNPWRAVISAIVIGLAIKLVSTILSKISIDAVEPFWEMSFYIKNAIYKLYMLILSVTTILLVNKGNLNGYGFNRAQNIKYPIVTLKVIGITFASMIFGGILFMGILNNTFPTGNSTAFPEHRSIPEMILTVWIWSSLCEEVFVRGFFQGFIQQWKHLKFLKLSLPVILSGLAFGAMHLSLLKAGMGMWFVAFIVFNTTIIGLLAAYYREKTDSIIPAFWVHFIANVVGASPLIIKSIIGV
ncbi:MAG: CPBP family intramembrane metalloprotease [Bacteroidales bacterium]|nr:CPBP family intramembrane metalloprotease [Bacteroidales bacterium]MBN2747931.1 CPBP family intramembrane metalloprotease [Bacteroidales bacterium]